MLEYSRSGQLLRSWTINGQDLAAEHGVQVATSDARGRLVLLDKAPARVLLLNPAQASPAHLRDLSRARRRPTTPHGDPGASCTSPTTPTRRSGACRRGGGEAAPWLQDPHLDGLEFGTTGIVTAADHRSLFVTQQSSAGGGDGNPTTGKLYEIEIGADGWPGRDPHRVGERPARRSRRLRDAMPTAASTSRLLLSNQIVVVAPGGLELERFPSAPGGGDNGSRRPVRQPVERDVPRPAADRRQPGLPLRRHIHQAILDVWIGVRGQREFIPRRAGLKPR